MQQTLFAALRAFAPDNRPAGTPWGMTQQADQILPGIWQVHTAGHGGIRVSEERWNAMPAALRLNPYGGGRWFEEDCEALFVLVAFLEEIEAANPEFGGRIRKIAAIKARSSATGGAYANAYAWMRRNLAN